MSAAAAVPEDAQSWRDEFSPSPEPPCLVFVALGSIGTLGHVALAAELARAAALMDPPVPFHLVTEQLDIPPHWRGLFAGISFLEPRPQDCSRGGHLNAEYTGSDVDALFVRFAGATWLFSTFFTEAWLHAVQRRAGTAVWVGYPMRQSFARIFHLDGYCCRFDAVLVLDDVERPVQHIACSVAEAHAAWHILPPPSYIASSDSSLPARESRRILVSCGGGAVNSTEWLGRRMIEQVVEHADGHPVTVLSGQLDLSWLRGSPSVTVVGSMQEVGSLALAITQAGYHTVHELLQRRVPMIAIPAFRNIDDQELRSVALVELGLAQLLLPSAIDRLGTLMRTALSSPAWLQQASREMETLVGERGWTAPRCLQAWHEALGVLLNLGRQDTGDLRACGP